MVIPLGGNFYGVGIVGIGVSGTPGVEVGVKDGPLGEMCIRDRLLFVLVAGSWMCSSFLSSALGGIPSMDTLIALCAAVLLLSLIHI